MPTGELLGLGRLERFGHSVGALVDAIVGWVAYGWSNVLLKVGRYFYIG